MLKLPGRQTVLARPIQSARLVLLPLDVGDTRHLWEAIDESREYLAPWLPWVAYTNDELTTGRFVIGSIADWDSARAIRLVIRSAASGALLGLVSLEQCSRLHRKASLGYWLRQSAQGHGVMTEAAATLVNRAFTEFFAHRIEVAAATTNYKSLAVIHRLGFHFEGIERQAEYCRQRWLDHAKFSLIASDFET